MQLQWVPMAFSSCFYSQRNFHKRSTSTKIPHRFDVSLSFGVAFLLEFESYPQNYGNLNFTPKTILFSILCSLYQR